MGYFVKPEIYTGETEPRGAKEWVPLTKDGVLIKSNVKRVLAGKPSVCWVYHQVAMEHLAQFDWPWSILRYESTAVTPLGRWKDSRAFVAGVHDL